MRKVDLRREFEHLYRASAREPALVDVPVFPFLMIDGGGDPNTSELFQQATEALYGVSYTLKFTAKKGPLAIDYPVMPLEGLWWAEDMVGFSTDRRDDWKWTLMIMQPEFITAEMIAAATEQVAKKRKSPALPGLRLESYQEGPSAQIMHVGPYSEEGPTIERLHGFIRDKGLEVRGKHHEIYLSDPRRARPEKLRTLLRQPVA